MPLPPQSPLSPSLLRPIIIALIGALSACASNNRPADPNHPAAKLHSEATVVDLHADPTLWNVDVINADDRQAALPQLNRGQVDAVVFGIPSQGLPIIGGWMLFSLWRGYPREARRSPWAAALHQINLLHAASGTANSTLVLVSDYDSFQHHQGKQKTLGFIGVEGGHAIEGDLSRLKKLKELGVLYIGPVHLSDNRLGGSNYQLGPIGPGGGLTPLGHEFVQEVHRLGMIIDLAHASAETFNDILEASTGPVMVSHTGLSAVHKSWRNLSDDQIRAVAKRGGVIGIMFGNHYLGDDTLDAYLDHIMHGVSVVGAEHISLGTDFDGLVPLPDGINDAGDLHKVTEGLLKRGLSHEQIKLVLGQSFVNFLQICAKKKP